MNQDIDELNVHARLGLVRIPAGSCCEGQRWEEYTPQAAIKLISDILLARLEAEYQLRAIVKACAEGHDWSSGYNNTFGDKTTVYSCKRLGCDEQREEQGWLPFEPKQHRIPFPPATFDCTGPGCEYCDYESFGTAFRKIMADGAKKLDETLFATGGLVDAASVYRVGEDRDCGYLTPEKLRAARDRLLANNRYQPDTPFGIKVVEDPSIPPDTFYAIGSCGCGHPVTSHDNLGCNRRIGHCDVCPCTVDVTQLADKITGIGEES